MAASSRDGQVKQGNSTLFVIVIISVSVIAVITIGVLYRVKIKKPGKITKISSAI